MIGTDVLGAGAREGASAAWPITSGLFVTLGCPAFGFRRIVSLARKRFDTNLATAEKPRW